MHHVSAVRQSLLHIDLRGGTVGRRRSCHCAKGREKRGSISRKRPPECRTLQIVPDFSSHRHWPRLTKSAAFCFCLPFFEIDGVREDVGFSVATDEEQM